MTDPVFVPAPVVAPQLVATDLVLRVPTWAEFKEIVLTRKGLRLNYLETENAYDVRGSDTERFVHVLQKGSADAIDFELNFKGSANSRYDTRTVLVTEAGVLAISEIGTTFPVGATAVAGETESGNTSALKLTDGGVLKVQDLGEKTHSRIAIGGTSPSAPGTVALPGVAVPSGMTEVKIEATLATTDGTPTGGDLSVWVQTSVDGSDWTDWCPLALGLNSGTDAYSVRYADAPPPASIEGVVPVGKNLTPSAQLPCGGVLENFVRVIFVAGAGTNHGVLQTIWLIGAMPDAD